MFSILLLIVVFPKWVQSQDYDGQGGVTLEIVLCPVVGSPQCFVLAVVILCP